MRKFQGHDVRVTVQNFLSLRLNLSDIFVRDRNVANTGSHPDVTFAHDRARRCDCRNSPCSDDDVIGRFDGAQQHDHDHRQEDGKLDGGEAACFAHEALQHLNGLAPAHCQSGSFLNAVEADIMRLCPAIASEQRIDVVAGEMPELRLASSGRRARHK